MGDVDGPPAAEESSRFSGADGMLSGQAGDYSDPASKSGIAIEGTLSLADAHTRFIGQRRNDGLGGALSLAGDLDGDGKDDVVLGASQADIVEVEFIDDYSSPDEDVGKAYVIFDPEPGDFPVAYADVRLIGSSIDDHVGRSVSAAGDVNGDGRADLVIGATGAGGRDTRMRPGQAYLYYSPHPRRLFEHTADADFLGSGEESFLGWSVSTSGDLNGDGFDDVVVSMPGASNDGEVLVYYGPVRDRYFAYEAGTTIRAEEGGSTFGRLVSSEGDLNGDGLADVVMNAPENTSYDCGQGVVYVLYSPLGSNHDVKYADATLYGTQGPAHLGYSFSTGGDVNGDGFDDLLVGARDTLSNCNPEGQEENHEGGHAYLFYGPVEGEIDVAEADVTLEGEWPVESFGISVSLTGDLDRDGFDDLVIGATGDVDDDQAGAVFVFYGPLSSTSYTSEEADATLLGEEDNMRAGNRVASGGDVNGDGFDDILISAPGLGPHGEYGGTVYLVLGGPRGQESGP